MNYCVYHGNWTIFIEKMSYSGHFSELCEPGISDIEFVESIGKNSLLLKLLSFSP